MTGRRGSGPEFPGVWGLAGQPASSCGGARVAVHCGRNEAAAARAGPAEPATVPTLFAALDREADSLDILVNNAGIVARGATTATPEAAFDRLFAINVKAVWLVTQHALERRRLRDGGRIVNIGTGLTRAVLPEPAAYSATKGAVDVLTLHWAAGLGPRGITVNCVAAGAIDIDMNADWLEAPEGRAFIAGQQALARVGEAEDVADAVAFLCRPDGRWLTGQRTEASGGWRL